MTKNKIINIFIKCFLGYFILLIACVYFLRIFPDVGEPIPAVHQILLNAIRQYELIEKRLPDDLITDIFHSKYLGGYFDKINIKYGEVPNEYHINKYIYMYNPKPPKRSQYLYHNTIKEEQKKKKSKIIILSVSYWLIVLISIMFIFLKRKFSVFFSLF